MPDTFYEPMPRSPATELADDIDNLENSIPVLNTDVFPDPPNLATIGQGMITTVVDSGTCSEDGEEGEAAADVLEDDTKAWTPNAFVGMIIRIIAGAGAGQRRIIASNTATVITVTDIWGTLPDATSEYDILSSQGSPISETILYTGKAVGALTGVTRGYEPEFSARAWPGGTMISRVLAAQDIRALQNRAVAAEGDIDALETLTGLHGGRLDSLEDDRDALMQWYRVNRVWGAV